MKISQLLASLQQEISPEECRALTAGEGLIIGQANRETMLEMLDRTSCPEGSVDQQAVAQLRQITQDYLAQYMADQPAAWKWIILACVYRTFVCQLPMHPESAVHFTVAQEDGRTVYYCPAKTVEGVTNCTFCVCRSLPQE